MKSVATFAAAAAAVFTGVSSACSTPGNFKVTFYGWPDNDPAGPATSYDCLGRGYKAGGDGSYANPITIATAPGELNECEIVYLPLLTKYGIVQDYCAACTDDWASGIPHIDIWTGSNSSGGGQNQINCEDNLTFGGTYSIVRNPPTNYGVDHTPLFVAPNTCNTNHVYPSNPAHC